MNTILKILLASILIFFGCQTVKIKENNMHFTTAGEQEEYWAKLLFTEKYEKQNFPQFKGRIQIIDENTFKFDDKVLIVYNTSESLKKIFTHGLFYPKILALPSEFKEIDILNTTVNIADSLTISNFEEKPFLSNSPKVKRFGFLLISNGTMNPTVFFIELTNENATNETDIETFINGARLTFYIEGWTMI